MSTRFEHQVSTNFIVPEDVETGRLFYTMMYLSSHMQTLASIVQNPGVELTEADIAAFNSAISALTNDISIWQHEVLTLIGATK